MLAGLEALLELSRIDTELAARERERAQIPARRAAAEEERARARERREASRAAIGEAELAQRQSEGVARDKEALLAKLEGQQHQVKTNEAYTALLHEMDRARQAISDAETRILEAMEAIEQARADTAALERELAALEQRLEAEERRLAERERALEEEMPALRARREGVVGGIEAGLLELYTRIARRRSPAIALVNRETCLGCRVDIPPQSYIEILKGESVVTCGHCQRILVPEEAAHPAPEP